MNPFWSIRSQLQSILNFQSKRLAKLTCFSARPKIMFIHSPHREIELSRYSYSWIAGGEFVKSPENILKLLAGDHCVSVSITQSRLIARGHQRRLILFRIGSIPRKNYGPLFSSFMKREQLHRSLFVSLSSAGSIRTTAFFVKDWRSIIDL